MAGRISNKAKALLIVEPHPETYIGYPFITLIQYKHQHLITIIDNADDKTIKAYVLDLCGPENVDEESIIVATSKWYETNRTNFPISIEFSKLRITTETSKILRTFNIDSVTRVIGPIPRFLMDTAAKIKRRKRRPLPVDIEIHKNVIPLNE
jgi:hypothetical protein